MCALSINHKIVITSLGNKLTMLQRRIETKNEAARERGREWKTSHTRRGAFMFASYFLLLHMTQLSLERVKSHVKLFVDNESANGARWGHWNFLHSLPLYTKATLNDPVLSATHNTFHSGKLFHLKEKVKIDPRAHTAREREMKKSYSAQVKQCDCECTGKTFACDLLSR